MNNEGPIMLIAILLAPVFGMIGAAMARSRNRNVMAWGIACCITGIFGIIVLSSSELIPAWRREPQRPT